MSARQHSPESRSAYKRLQRQKKRYQELREILQLAGEIPTEPVGATFSAQRPNGHERVDPTTQGEVVVPTLVTQAIRSGWAVPEGNKPRLVDEMVRVIDDPEESTKVKVAAFNALRQADQSQWERDNPKEKAEQAPTEININVVTVESGDQQLTDVVVDANGVNGGVIREYGAGLPQAARLPRE